MPLERLANFILLPELKLLKMVKSERHQATYSCTVEKQEAGCSKCAPGAIRTPDPMLRRHVLYPAELRVHDREIVITRTAHLDRAALC